jgi:hypothetical protein
MLTRSIQDRGLIGTAKYVAHRTVASNGRPVDGRLYRCALPIERIPAQSDLRVELLKPSQYSALANGGRYDLAAIVRSHYAGYRCYVAWIEDTIASYAWCVRGREFFVSDLNQTLKLAPDQVYLSDCYTTHPWRGRGLYPTVLRSAMWHVSQEGAREAFIVASDTNLASIRGIEKAGFTPASSKPGE